MPSEWTAGMKLFSGGEPTPETCQRLITACYAYLKTFEYFSASEKRMQFWVVLMALSSTENLCMIGKPRSPLSGARFAGWLPKMQPVRSSRFVFFFFFFLGDVLSRSAAWRREGVKSEIYCCQMSKISKKWWIFAAFQANMRARQSEQFQAVF